MARNNKNNMRSKFYFYLICKTLKKEKNKYENMGYLISKGKNNIHIKYEENNYKLFVLKEKNEYYLKLVPYKNSYFQTDLNYKDLKLKIHMSLFAITESK